MIRTLAAAALILLAGCGQGGSSSSPPAGTPVDTGPVATFSISSDRTGATYPIWVIAPADSATGPPPPTIYVLDAETRFSTISAVLHDSGVRATIVGVGNTGGDRRQVDFLEPGADPYYDFLVLELVPLIGSRYRVDPDRRVLSGHSSGGLFCMYAFFKTMPTRRPFSDFVCADGSYWQQPAQVADAEAGMYAANPGHDLPVTVVMGGDQYGNLQYMDPLYQQVLSRHYSSLRISEHAYAMGHVQMDAPFFNDALAILFPRAH